jgi:TetR/AcrR family fatty acid metabolism transcriptional regulator
MESLGGVWIMHTTHSHRSLKERQRQEREALILQVAEEVLMEKGYHETSIDEIAARVGIAKGTVYLHFPSKEELVVAIFTRDVQNFLQAVDSAIDSQQTNRGKIEALLHFLYGGLFGKRIQLLYSMYNTVDLHHLFAEKGACMHDLWEQFIARMTKLLDQGKAAGEFDATLPTNVMLSAFFSLLSPRSYERLVVQAQMTPEDLVKYLSRIYFDGIAAKA